MASKVKAISFLMLFKANTMKMIFHIMSQLSDSLHHQWLKMAPTCGQVSMQLVMMQSKRVTFTYDGILEQHDLFVVL